jgi:hypothetical protein
MWRDIANRSETVKSVSVKWLLIEAVVDSVTTENRNESIIYRGVTGKVFCVRM